MADDGDDFVFDEDGIYRERGLDTDQDFLDEDGIWRDDDDDDDDDKDHLDRYTFRTDSGLGTAERRSSISTLNKAPFHRTRYGGSIDLDDDDDFSDHHHRHGSYTVGEKSLNISDLEASASAAGDYDFERVSLDSNAEVDLPELNDRLSDGSTDRTQTDVGDLNDFDDFEGSRDSTGLFDDSLTGGGHLQGARRRSPALFGRSMHAERGSPQSKPRYPDDDSLDRIHVTRTHSYDDSFRYADSGGNQRRARRPSVESSLHSQPKDHLSQPRGSSNNQSIADYLLSGGDNAYRRPSSALSELELQDEVGQLRSRPPVMGDSIFTQEEDTEVLSYHQRHSLMEFEQLEAALDGDGQSEKSADQMDLIGAYLQGLQDQEQEEEDEQEVGQSYDRSRGIGQQSLRTGHDGGRNSMPPQEDAHQEDRQRSLERLISSDHAHHDDSVEFHMSEAEVEPEVPSSKQQLSRSNAVEESDVHENRQRAGQSTRSPRQVQRREPMRKGERQQESFETANNTTTFDDSVSFLENQQPPFDSMSFSTLDMTGGTNEAVSRNATMSEANASRPSKIPMLRSRSPSMTRPGSTSPNRSRAPTPDRTRGRTRHSEGRSLPKTPQRSISQESATKRVTQYASSREGSLQRETSGEVDEDNTYNRTDRSRFSEEEESELDKAASLLLGQTDPVDMAGMAAEERTVSQHQSARRKSSASTSDSRPGSARGQRQVALGSLRQRPSSAEGARGTSKKDFKTRPAASGLLGSQPLRAIGREVEEADRALQEAQQRQLNEETLKQLQQDYNTLLQKYAQAENTIDSLRIGATIPINVELISTGGATSGSTATAAPPSGAPPAAPPGGGSLNNSTNAPRARPGHGSRPGSARSQRSNSVQTGQSQGQGGHAASTDQVNLAASLSGEGDKLALLAKTKAVEEKAHALSILLSENCLSTADQVQALQNVRDGHEELQQEYRDARAHHDYLARRGELPPDTPGFDDDKAVEGELYKLGMKVDDLEQQVQENVKVRSSARVPFKADHSIDLSGMKNSKSETGDQAGELPPNRPPSVGSFAGGPEDIDEQLHRLTKDYNQLMDRYRRLKQLKKTPERDMEIDGLLKNLRRIYEQTPDHRKPALPPELENHYNPVKDNFMSSESEAPRRGSLAMYSSKGQETDSLPGLNESDLSIGRYSKGRMPDRKNSTDYTSSATDSTTRQKRQKRLHSRPPLAPASYDSLDSATSTPSRRSESSVHGGRYPGMAPGGKRRERDDKDSGYVGSEASRKVANQGHEKDSRLHPGQGLRRSTRSLSKSDHGTGAASDVTKSTSDLSTVEHVRPYRPPGAARNNRKVAIDGDGAVTVAGGSRAGLRGARTASEPALARRGAAAKPGNVTRHSDVTDSDVSSHGSQETSRSRPSVKSEQIQTLADEITKLREELRTRDNPPVTSAAASTTSQPTTMTSQPMQVLQTQPAPSGQQYAYMYSYPYQEDSRLQQVVPEQENIVPQNGVYYTTQTPSLPVGGRPHVLAPAAAPVVQPPEVYATDPHYTAPVQSYHEFREPLPVERWETYDRRRDYSDRRRDRGDHGDRRTGYYSDDDNHRSRERDRERQRRLRDYYIPRDNSPVQDTSRGRYGHGPDRMQYPSEVRYQATPGYHTARPTGPLPVGVRPPTYQQVQQAGPCGMCGGTGQHSHGAYVYAPHGGTPPAVQTQQQPIAAPGYVLVPANSTQQQVQPAQSSAYIPVNVVEKAAKVRYYVREYGGEPEVELKPIRRSVSHGNLSRAGRKVKHVLLEEAVSDTEGQGGDLNDSLNSALHTASQLKVMSRRMKKTLKTELDQSLRGSLRAMAY